MRTASPWASALLVLALAGAAAAQSETPTETATVAPTPTPTETSTAQPTPRATATEMPTPTVTPSVTLAPTPTMTPSVTLAPTPTQTATPTRTVTRTPTTTPSVTLTPTRTSSRTRTSTGTPTAASDGDCCGEHPEPGCAVASCQNCVCGPDPACCDAAESWDQFCVDRANGSCAPECPCGGPTPTITPGGDPCCTAHTGAGCGNATCESCVCLTDDFCCTNGWDPMCVETAQQRCTSFCGCLPPPPPTATASATRTRTATPPPATSTRTSSPPPSSTRTAGATPLPTEAPSPTATPTPDLDLDGSGSIDDGDVRVLLAAIFGTGAGPHTDLNGDERTGAADLVAFFRLSGIGLAGREVGFGARGAPHGSGSPPGPA